MTLGNLTLVEKEVPREFSDLVDILHAVKEVRMATYGQNKKYCSPRPNPYFKNVLTNLERKWKHAQSKFNITCPNKVHHMCHNIPEIIERKKLALGKTSDHLIESTQQHTNRIFSRSNYYVKDVNSPADKTKLLFAL